MHVGLKCTFSECMAVGSFTLLALFFLEEVRQHTERLGTCYRLLPSLQFRLFTSTVPAECSVSSMKYMCKKKSLTFYIFILFLYLVLYDIYFNRSKKKKQTNILTYSPRCRHLTLFLAVYYAIFIINNIINNNNNSCLPRCYLYVLYYLFCLTESRK